MELYEYIVTLQMKYHYAKCGHLPLLKSYFPGTFQIHHHYSALQFHDLQKVKSHLPIKEELHVIWFCMIALVTKK